jgi:hypothetical protein
MLRRLFGGDQRPAGSGPDLRVRAANPTDLEELVVRPSRRSRAPLRGLLAGLLVFLASCPTTREGKVRITQRPMVANIDSAGTVNVDATCIAGEKLLGGGYSFSEPPLSTGNPLIVEASYPLNDESWRIVVTRPASFEQDRDGIPLAVSWATCAALPEGDLRADIVESPEATASFSPSFETATATATCPADTVLTGGGFRVSPAADDEWTVAGLFNSWIWDSAPTSDGGWAATLRRITGQQGPTPPTLRAYSVCAGSPIDSSHIVEADAGKREPINFVYWDGLAQCEGSEVASGGGYSFSGDALVPHLVATTKPEILDRTWTVTAIHGHQTGSSGGVSVKAVCIGVPVIVDVAILNPRGEICTDCTVLIEHPVRVGVDPADPTMSEQIEFAAEATDGAGDPLTGNALVWTSYTDPSAAGSPLGIGESFTARLPAPPTGQATIGYLIEVVAADPSGATASDSVVVIVERGV